MAASKEVTASGKRRPPNAGKGRPKGTPNKSTAAVKEALALAFQGLGGVARLQSWADENPTEFFKLWSKMLPAEVQASMEHTGELVVRVVRQAGGGSTRGA